MAIFAVMPSLPRGENLGRTIEEKFKDANYPMEGGHGWLVSANSRAQAISDSLGITDGTNGSAVVFEVAAYFGRANPALWNWIKLHWEAGQNV